MGDYPYRGSKLRPERTDLIIENLRKGAFLSAAAGSGGVSRRSWNAWRARGEKALGAYEATLIDDADWTIPTVREDFEARQGGTEDGRWPPQIPISERPYVAFYAESAIAMHEGEIRHFAKIDEASGGGDWKASAWILSHRYHDNWKDRTHVEHAGDPDGVPIAVAAQAAPPASAREVADTVNALAEAGQLDPELGAALAAFLGDPGAAEVHDDDEPEGAGE